MKHSFKPRKGLNRVEVGNLEIGAAGYTTGDARLAHELSENPFLVRNDKTASRSRAPRKKRAAAAPANAAAPAATAGEVS